MRRLKIFTGWFALSLAAITLFVGVFAGVTIWRVSQEPISLHRFTPYIVSRLNQSMGGARLSVEDIVLYWRGWDERFNVRLRDVAVFGPDDSQLLHIPEAGVVFSRKALFEGVLALREVNLIAPKIRLLRDADGNINVGYSETALNDSDALSMPATSPGDVAGQDMPPAPPSVTIDLPGGKPGEMGNTGNTAEEKTPDAPITEDRATSNATTGEETVNGLTSGSRFMTDIIEILSGERRDFPAAAYFESFGVVDADLQVRDEQFGIVWAAPQADILLSRQPTGIAADASMDVTAGALATTVKLRADYSRAMGEIDLAAQIGEVELADLRSISDVFDFVENANVPVSGQVSAKLDQTGALISAKSNLDVGGGVISLPDALRATYPVRGGRIEASFVPGRLSFDHVAFDVDESRVGLQGVILDPLSNWSMDIDVTAANVATDDLRYLWPKNVGAHARDWVTQNLSDGIVHQASLKTRLHQETDGNIVVDALGGDMNMTGVTVHYLGDMPSVKQAGGRAEFDETSFSIFVNAGEADGIIVDDANIKFTELETPIPKADIEIVAHGGVQDALHMIEAEPLGFASKLGIDPTQINGEQATRVRLRFPLLLNVTFDDIDVAAASRIENATVKKAFRNLDVTSGDFELQVNTEGLELTGTVAVGQGKTQIKWVESFTDDSALVSRYNLSGDLDLAVLKDIDLDASPYLGGMATGDVTIDVVRNGSVALMGDVDLSGVTLAVPDLEYRKAAGSAGHAKFDMTVERDGGGVVRKLGLSAPALDLVGSGQWRGGNQMADQWAIQVENAQFRQNQDVSGSARMDQSGKLIVDLSGTQFDLRSLIDTDEAPETPATDHPDTTPPADRSFTLTGGRFLIKGAEPVLSDGSIHLRQTGYDKEVEINVRQAIATPWIVGDETSDEEKELSRSPNSGGIGQNTSRAGGRTDIFLNIDQLVMANNELITGVEGSIHVVGEEWDGLILNGTLGDRSNIFAEVKRKDFITRTVSLTTEDAGRFLRSVGLYESLLGGTMTVKGTVDDSDWSQPFTGTARIEQFRVLNAPIAARVLGAASLTGLTDILQGNGIAFNELNGEFTYANDVLSLSKVAANGSAIGVTANGSIDLAKSEIRLAGSIVPVYALNSALGAIPLLGDLLVGEEGGGIFAPTYTVEGDLADPDVSVNPLSTFVPGVLRNLITGAEPG